MHHRAFSHKQVIKAHKSSLLVNFPLSFPSNESSPGKGGMLCFQEQNPSPGELCDKENSIRLKLPIFLCLIYCIHSIVEFCMIRGKNICKTFYMVIYWMLQFSCF